MWYNVVDCTGGLITDLQTVINTLYDISRDCLT